MVLVKEYRIPLPLSLDEYKRGQLYMVARYSREQSKGGEWVDILVNEPYENETGKGQYTHKVIHIDNQIPGWVRYIIPASALEIHEKSWNAYPYSKTEYSCPFFGERFRMTIETRYEANRGETENALGLDPKELKNRGVEVVDIVNDPLDPTKYKEEEDLTKFVSQKTGRGPLSGDWVKGVDPVMCCYKLCTVEFKYWGLQSKVENYIHQNGLRGIFLLGHRQVTAWIDEWFEMTMEDIREYEEETKRALEQIRQQNQAAQ